MNLQALIEDFQRESRLLERIKPDAVPDFFRWYIGNVVREMGYRTAVAFLEAIRAPVPSLLLQ